MGIGPLVAAVILAAVYILTGRVRFERIRRRNEWISAAAGITLAYIFVDILPALARRQALFAEQRHAFALFPEERVYIAALLGFLTFYSLEHTALRSRARQDERVACGLTCWLDTVGFALYSGLVAYFLNRWVGREAPALLFYTIAMALHFLVVGHSLREDQGDVYKQVTRYILAGSVLVGWGVGVVGGLPEPILDTLVGFVAGGVVINSITKEMPREGEARFRAFVLGAVVYALLLLLAE